MKRLLFLLLLLPMIAFGQAPYQRNSFTTNSTGKLPDVIPFNTFELTPLMTRINDGTNVNSLFTAGNSFTSTLTNTAFKGWVSLSGRTNRLTVAGNALLLDGVAVGGSAQVWTNDAGKYRLVDYPTNVIFTPLETVDNYVLGYGNQSLNGAVSVRLIGHGLLTDGGVDNYLVGYDNSISNSAFEVFVLGDNNHISDAIAFVVGSDNKVDTSNRQNNWILGRSNQAESESANTIFLGRYNTNRSSSSGILGFGNTISSSSGNSYFVGENNSMGSTGNDHSYAIGRYNVVDQRFTYGLGEFLHMNGLHNVLIGIGNDQTNMLAATRDNAVELGIGTIPQLSIRADSVAIIGNGTDTITLNTNGTVSLNGKTNLISDNGTSLTYNGNPIATGGNTTNYFSTVVVTNLYASNFFATNITVQTINSTTNIFNIAKGAHVTVTNNLIPQEIGASKLVATASNGALTNASGVFGTRGSILYKGASDWAALTPNTAGYVLTDGGVGADPSWAAAAGGGAGVNTHVTTLTWSGTNVQGFNCITNGETFILLVTNNCLFGASTFSNLPSKTAYQTYTLALQMDSTGGYVVSFTNSICDFVDGVMPVIKTNANAVSYLYWHSSMFTNSMLVGSPAIDVRNIPR